MTYPKPHPLGGCTETAPGTLAIRGMLTREPVDHWHSGHYGAIKEFVDKVVSEGLTEAIFDIDSPGGDVSGLSLLCHHIRDAPIKIKAVITGTCASAAYCIASACDVIEAYDDSVIGSIGAYFLTPPPPEGVHISSLTPLKLQGGEDVQRVADDNGIRFLQDVAGFRSFSGAIEDIAERCGRGAIFTPQEALKRGLIDVILSSKGQMTMPEDEIKEEVVEEVTEEVKDEAPEDPQIDALVEALIPRIAEMVEKMIEAKLSPPSEETSEVTEEVKEEVTEGGAKAACDRAARADVKRLTFALLRRDGAFASKEDENRASRLYDRDRGLFKEYYEEGASQILKRYSHSETPSRGAYLTGDKLEAAIGAYIGNHKGVGYTAAKNAVLKGKK